MRSYFPVLLGHKFLDTATISAESERQLRLSLGWEGRKTSVSV